MSPAKFKRSFFGSLAETTRRRSPYRVQITELTRFVSPKSTFQMRLFKLIFTSNFSVFNELGSENCCDGTNGQACTNMPCPSSSVRDKKKLFAWSILTLVRFFVCASIVDFLHNPKNIIHGCSNCLINKHPFTSFSNGDRFKNREWASLC